ncbi:MAG: hydrogenase maturation nickel metallochaperone HypA [Gemmataceae bacterium]
MHELSIAESLVAIALDALREETGRVDEVRLRLGRLAGVERESLQFCYEIVTAGTPLAGSRLEIEDVPVVIYCPVCRDELELPGIQSFLCPRCGGPSSQVRRGRELELTTIRLAD